MALLNTNTSTPEQNSTVNASPTLSPSPEQTLESTLKTFSDNNYDFTFQYNEDKWNVYTEAESGVAGITISDVDNENRKPGKEYNGMSINVENTGGLLIEQVREGLLASSDQIAPSGIVERDTQTKVGIYPTDKVTISQNGRDVYIYYGFTERDKFFVVTIAALNEDKLKEFEKIMESITLR